MADISANGKDLTIRYNLLYVCKMTGSLFGAIDELAEER